MMSMKSKTDQINVVLDLIARTNRSLMAARAANERLQTLQYERLKNQFLRQLTDLLEEETATYYVAERV